MSKTIKFNLIVDGKNIRTLEDLKENFNIDDVYDLYERGILKKWLDVRGYKEESERLDALIAAKPNNISAIIIGLIKVFAPLDQDFNPQEEAYAQIFRVIKQARVEEAKRNEYEHNHVIEQYHLDYEMLKESIIVNCDNFDYIKICIKEISEKFAELFRLDYRKFFFDNVERAPLAVFAVLMNEELRNIFLKDEFINRRLNTLYSDNSVLLKIKNNLKVFKGTTQGMWQYLGEADQKNLVIRLSNGACRVGERRADNIDLSAEEINGTYKILQGLLFKSTSASLEVVYLEV